MPEPTDAIMPILQRIQADIGDLKRDLGSKIDGLSVQVKDVSERMDAFEDYFTFTMGVTQQNKADLARLGSDVRAIKSRVDVLEDR
jgi:predicted amino acid-binding ACT domain protein